MPQAVAETMSPDEQKATALKLLGEGRHPSTIAPIVGRSTRTIERWRSRFREIDRTTETPLLLDDWTRIVSRAQGMQHAVLDVLEDYAAIASSDNPHPLAQLARIVAQREILKYALTPNVYAGTGTDKLQKDKEQSQPPALTQVLIVLNANSPEEVAAGAQKYIEAQSSEVEDEATTTA